MSKNNSIPTVKAVRIDSGVIDNPFANSAEVFDSTMKSYPEVVAKAEYNVNSLLPCPVISLPEVNFKKLAEIKADNDYWAGVAQTEFLDSLVDEATFAAECQKLFATKKADEAVRTIEKWQVYRTKKISDNLWNDKVERSMLVEEYFTGAVKTRMLNIISSLRYGLKNDPDFRVALGENLPINPIRITDRGYFFRVDGANVTVDLTGASKPVANKTVTARISNTPVLAVHEPRQSGKVEGQVVKYEVNGKRYHHYRDAARAILKDKTISSSASIQALKDAGHEVVQVVLNNGVEVSRKVK